MAVISLLWGFHRFGFFFLSLFCVLFLQCATGRELKFVLVIMRHGDRNPLSTYPNDLYKEDTWPEGYGQLTKFGMKQQFKLGEFLRKRYDHFLSSQYHRKEIYVRSTDADRAIMSAQANLAGLFPPIGEQVWSSEIDWQPVPVHDVPIKKDRLLVFPILNCTRFHTLLKETMKTPKVADRVKSYMPFLTSLADHSGYDVKTLLDFTNAKLWNLYDAIHIQSDRNLQLPKWATPKVKKELQRLLMFGLTAGFKRHKRKEKSRLQGGVLVKDILEKITKAAQNTSQAKMIMYSAYDITIIALQMALDVFEKQMPRFAASYFFELYQEKDGAFSIEMYYRNSNYLEKPPAVILPGCTAACPMEKFKELVAPIVPNNWEAECSL